MICEELEREITSETCAAMKKHSWCERSCEERKVILKVPEALPEIIAQDGQISTITPKEVQSTSETTKTILVRSGKPKAKIEGYCQRRKEKLVWNACLQRKHRKIGLCESCNPNTEFLFSEQPMGQGWHNSAARAGEMECPELDGRKLKKSTCIMRQGKRHKAGKSCDCEHWKGEKMGPQFTYFCPTPYCHRQVEVEGMRCGDCQIEELKKVESQKNPCPPDNSYERHILSTEIVKPNHVRLIGISEQLMMKIAAHERGMQEIRKITESMQSLACEILEELQKAVKEVEGAKVI